jgi:hypothetical protein
MRVLRIDAQTLNVVNAEEWGELPADTAETLYRESATGGQGWTWDAGAGAPVAPEPVVSVPSSVTMRQAQLALHAAGLWSGVKARAASDDEFDIWLRTSQMVERQNTVLLAAATDMGLSSDQVDALFVAASALP